MSKAKWFVVRKSSTGEIIATSANQIVPPKIPRRYKNVVLHVYSSDTLSSWRAKVGLPDHKTLYHTFTYLPSKQLQRLSKILHQTLLSRFFAVGFCKNCLHKNFNVLESMLEVCMNIITTLVSFPDSQLYNLGSGNETVPFSHPGKIWRLALHWCPDSRPSPAR